VPFSPVQPVPPHFLAQASTPCYYEFSPDFNRTPSLPSFKRQSILSGRTQATFLSHGDLPPPWPPGWLLRLRIWFFGSSCSPTVFVPKVSCPHDHLRFHAPDFPFNYLSPPGCPSYRSCFPHLEQFPSFFRSSQIIPRFASPSLADSRCVLPFYMDRASGWLRDGEPCIFRESFPDDVPRPPLW